MKSRKGFKILIGIVAGVILLLIVASFAVKIIFTKEKLMSMLVPKIEQALKRQVKIDDVTVSIWGGLGADVKGMRVLNPPGFVHEELFKFDQLSIRVNFWPLLRKRIEIKKLILENPEINLEKEKKGVSNFGDLIESKGGAIVIPFSFDQLQIGNAKIVYLDSQTGKEIVLHQFAHDARLELDDKMENARITGVIKVETVEMNFPDRKQTLPPLSLSVEHDINLNMPGDFVEVNALKIGIAKIILEMKGRLDKVSTAPVLNLTVQSDGISLEDVLASLPKAESSPLTQLKTSGNIALWASLKGDFGEKAPVQIEGKVTLQNGRVDFAKAPKPLDIPYGEINFNNRSLSFFSSDARLGEAPLELKLVVENFADPSLTSQLKTDLNLAILGELVTLPEKTDLAGRAEINVKAYGKIKQSEKMSFSGRVDLKKVEVATPALGVPVRNLDGTISFKESDVDIPGLSLSMGKSSLSLKGKAYGAIPYLLSPERGKPLLSFNLDSPFLDLDEILPVSKEDEKKGEAAAKGSIPLPDINASGQVSIQKLIFRKVELTNVSSKVNLVDGVLTFDNAAAKVYSGSVNGKVTSDLRNMDQTEFDMDLNASQIEANDFLSRFTGFDDHLFGKLNLEATFSGKGNRLEDIRRTLSANGRANFAEGKLIGWALLDSLASFLQIKGLKEQQIRTLKNSFRIADARVWFDDLSVSTKDGDFSLVGSLGLDGSLDYALTAVLSSELSLRFDALGDISDYLKNEQGRAVLDLKIGGTAKKPKFSLDTSRAQERLKAQLKGKAEEKKEEIQNQLKEKATDLLEGLLKKKKK
ncbi:MAG: AsmA family protein [Candidatus Zixiibacteriota bacterium]